MSGNFSSASFIAGRDQIAYTLTPQELQEAAEEWKHLCLMHRIISYLAEYHGIPLTMNLPNQEYKAKLLDFYDTYHIPFESLVKANESSVEELINAPDQVYLFLSSLAQTYELDEGYAGVPEKEGFLVLFQDKKTQSFAGCKCIGNLISDDFHIEIPPFFS